jgi:predicted PurR-regulated permease PerM
LYQKVSFNLLSLAIVCTALIYGKAVILPILFSILLANMLLPMTNFLERKKFPKILTILLPLVTAILTGIGIAYFLSSQVMHFMDDIPSLQEKADGLTDSLQEWFRNTTHITIRKQNQYIHDTMGDLKEKAPKLVGLTFASLTGILTYMVLIPVYTFLILYFRSKIKLFLVKMFRNGSEENVRDILTESTTIAQRYLTGLSIETVVVFTLNTIGFVILGIKYAVFLALLAALLNLIPYVGILVANVICMVITLASSEQASDVVWVGVIMAIVQFLDNNFGMPLVVGNTVRINALVTILGVIIGGALCGIAGMFLAIPVLAVLKVIFDRAPGLEPWGELIGDDTRTPGLKLRSSARKAK